VRGKRVIGIDMEIPTESLAASLSGRRLRGPRRIDPAGRYWALRLPRRIAERSVLYLDADFTQAELRYGAALRRVRR
jgi:hypothetical protein